MRKVLVLGGRGMLGQMISRVLSRSKSLTVEKTARQQGMGSLYFDVEEGTDGLRRILKDQGPFDYLINCIGVLQGDVEERDSKSVRRAIVVNALFPHDLATAAQEAGARVIHVSTDGVFSRYAGVCLEDAPMDCDDIYGKTKSLGEVIAADFLVLRCSIVGPDPLKRRGLLEWFLSQPSDTVIAGFTDHQWNGVTTMQFAELCHALILEGNFEKVRREGPIHHFCPNQTVSKYELLQLFKCTFQRQVMIRPVAGQATPVSRVLDTRYKALRELSGYGLPVQDAVQQLACEIPGAGCS